MIAHRALINLGLLLAVFFAQDKLQARSVYLNGVDISGAASQDLKKVDIHINDKGDVFITAPHYEVHEQDSYLPLSSYMQKRSAFPHKPPKPLSKTLETGSERRGASLGGDEERDVPGPQNASSGLPALPAQASEPNGQLEKQGSNVPPSP